MNNKLLGIMQICFGVLIVGILLMAGIDEFASDGDSFFFDKYFIIIFVLNAGMYFIIFGCLSFFGKVKPYFSKDITDIEKSKQKIISFILSSPIVLTVIIVVFEVSSNVLWKLLVAIFGLFLVFELIKSCNNLKKGIDS